LDVWTQPFADNTWDPAFGSFPIAWGKTRSFAIREPNQDTVYIAYEDGSKAPTNDTFGKLFRADNAHPTNNFQWNNISPGQTQYHGITSLVTDPRTMKRLWVSLGNIGANDPYNPTIMVNKVVYSGDYGSTWLDISRGLPPVPVNKLLYLEGSDDILFAGTDAGVFRWNKTDSTWYCFNTGLPPCVVTDMEFNYCAGKLRIATFGRGIWETPAFDNSYVSNPSNVITSNTTWASTRYLKSGVRVTNGATLTIQNTGQDQTVIYMPKNGSIIVEPGAQLVVNGARLTNGCEDCMWNGIRLVGQTNQPQGTSLQGKLVLSGGAVIEHAKIGVANYGPDTLSPTNTGGIIEAVDATFLNNARAVSIQEYKHQSWNAWSPVLKNYLTRFSECDFIVNNDFKGGTTDRFLSHVAMYGVDGPRFKSCGFYNRNSSTLYSGEGDGIRASNTGFTVTVCTGLPFACTPDKRNQFTGLRTGVWAEYDQVSMQHAVAVDRSNFDSCTVGIRIVGQHAFIASRDSFRIGYGKTTFIDPYDCYKNVGIWTEHSYSPYIEGNHFVGLTHGGQHAWHENIGTITDNSSSSNKQIYRNSFLNLGKACYARGVNRENFVYGSNNPSGLRYYCNTYDDNEYDIIVKKMGMHSSNVVQGIAYNQGTTAASAGNEFLDRSSVNHIVNDANGLITYYHTTGNYIPNTHPTWPGNFWMPFSASSAHECAATYAVPSGGSTGTNFPIGTTDLTDIKYSFRIAKDNKDAEESTLDGLIDGGSTTSTITYINGSTQADSPTVRTTLLGYSPYLTVTVLTALADANILPQEGLLEVLEANPEMLRDEEFLEHLENNIPNPLNSAQIDMLRATAETEVTDRSDKQTAISEYAMQMDWYGNLVLMHYLLDTTSDDRDSIPVWLDNINTMRSMYLKAAFYTTEGDYTTAQAILDDIPETFELSTDDEDEHLLYMDVWDLVKSVYDDDRTLAHLNATEIDELENMGNNPLTTA
ncbi:MAG: hypothetical protein K8F30_13595, partial [Taibaiella sp.]|nr:hypothetical protein [Taibaiella sp.]